MSDLCQAGSIQPAVSSPIDVGAIERSIPAPVSHRVAVERALQASLLVIAACVLVITVDAQLFDTNFHTLWEATALFAGDHPYRDFFDWGLPMQAAVSLLAQLASGHRLIGEFVADWSFILASLAIAFRIALRTSQSPTATSVTMLLAVVLLAATPVYHYPKLFLYTIAVWVAWRYMDRPGTGRAVALGVLGTVAFLFRHDHGAYMVPLAFLAFTYARLIARATRSFRTLIRELAVCGMTAAILLAPWAIVVESSEGLPQYVQSRAAAFQDQSGKTFAYGVLARISPAHALTPDRDSGSGLPTHNDTELWLYQMTLLVPLLVLITYGVQWFRRREAIEPDAPHMIVAALFLVILETPALRQPSYFVVVTPITAALAARLVAGPPRRASCDGAGIARGIWFDRVPYVLARSLAVVVLIITTITALGWVRESALLRPQEAVRRVRAAGHRLFDVPPIDGYIPRLEALRVDRLTFEKGNVGERLPVMLRYVHDCTRSQDRILVTGSTPFQVGYYTERRIAGGHLYWHQRWRADAAHEAESLALLRTHRPPFAISTTDPVLQDFTVYPHIYQYLVANYVEVPGTGGLLLVDRRRQATSRFGAVGFPCFR
jgi:hypothetical protein